MRLTSRWPRIGAFTDERRYVMSALTENVNRADPLRGLRVSDAMRRGVLTCPLDAPLEAVARMMTRERIHCVVVQGSSAESELEGRLWGIVSDRDVLEAIAVEDVEDRTAGGSARGVVKTVPPDQDLLEATRIMLSTGTTHLVVVDPRPTVRSASSPRSTWRLLWPARSLRKPRQHASSS